MPIIATLKKLTSDFTFTFHCSRTHSVFLRTRVGIVNGIFTTGRRDRGKKKRRRSARVRERDWRHWWKEKEKERKREEEEEEEKDRGRFLFPSFSLSFPPSPFSLFLQPPEHGKRDCVWDYRFCGTFEGMSCFKHRKKKAMQKADPGNLLRPVASSPAPQHLKSARRRRGMHSGGAQTEFI